MIREELLNKVGLHARPAAALVQVARRFDSDVILEKEGERVNAKSIMGIMTLAIGPGSIIMVEISGEDEVTCFEQIAGLITNGEE